MDGFALGIYRVCEWVTRFAFVNLLWILFTILGFVVFGFFPATVAMFSVIRKWIMKESDVPVFKIFWSVYKTNLLKSNILGLILFVLGTALYIDIRIIEQFSAGWLKIVYYLLWVISFLYLLTLFYVVPVYIHYEIKLIKVFRVSFLLMILNPVFTISICAGVLFVIFLMNKIPGLIPFFSGSLLSFCITYFAYHAFLRNEQKLSKVN